MRLYFGHKLWMVSSTHQFVFGQKKVMEWSLQFVCDQKQVGDGAFGSMTRSQSCTNLSTKCVIHKVTNDHL